MIDRAQKTPSDTEGSRRKLVKFFAHTGHELRERKYPSDEEMLELNERRLNGDETARHRMILENLPLAYWYATTKCGFDQNFEDNVQASILGLMEAADKFDPATGGNFGTIAVLCMRKCVSRAREKESHTIRVPVRERSQIAKIRRLIEEAKQQEGYVPMPEELAQQTGFALKRIRDLLLAPLSTGSLDAPQELEEEDTLHGMMADTNSPLPSDRIGMREEFRSMIDRLVQICLAIERHFGSKSRHARMLYKWIGICGHGPAGRSLEEVGMEYGTSRNRSFQICERALELNEVHDLMPRGTGGMMALAENARQMMNVVYEDPNDIPHGILWLLGEVESDVHVTRTPIPKRTAV